MAEHLAPVDETVKVPDAVTRAAALAESFYQEPSKSEPEQPAEAPAEQAVEAPAEQPAETPVEQAPEHTPPPPKEPNWEHRYHSMEGRVKQLQQVNQNLLGQLKQFSEAPPQPPQPPKPLITPEERQTYGDELLSVVERKALEATMPKLTQLERENLELKQRLARGEANDVYTVLTAQLPNWRDINNSDEWKSWLSLPDLYSGMIRDQLLKSAFASGDAGRVLNFFRGFLAEHPSSQPSSMAQQPQAAQAPKRVPAVSLKTLAAPGRASPAPGAVEVPEEKPVITNLDIDRFYAKVRQGHYNGREQQKIADEARIHAAIVEGRVRQVKK